jgi:hypothetical protein
VGIKGTTQDRRCIYNDYYWYGIPGALGEQFLVAWAGAADGVGFNVPMLLDCSSYSKYKDNSAYWIGDVVGVGVAVVTLGASADIRIPSSWASRSTATTAAKTGGAVLNFGSRAAAREGLSGEAGTAANRFFRGATSKSQDFQAQELPGGGYRLQFFSPANNPGYGKLYVQEIDRTGNVLREYKDTRGPDGFIERKMVP